jgi:hypothetical protein
VTDCHIGSVASNGEKVVSPTRDAFVTINSCCALEMPYIAVNHRRRPPVGSSRQWFA